jgi:hypothetical protein
MFMCRLKNDDNNNISMVTATAANSVEQIYDVILGTGCIVFSILALANLLMMTINKFVEYYSRQIDRIVMDESFDESDDDDDSSESDYSEYSENESSDSECSDDDDDGNGNCSKRHHHHHDDIELSPYIPPRRSQRLLENRAKCNSPLLIRRLKFD